MTLRDFDPREWFRRLDAAEWPQLRWRRRRRTWLGTFVHTSVVAVLWCLIGASAVVTYYSVDLPPYRELLDARDSTSVTIYAADGSHLATRGDWYGGQIAAADMPDDLIKAVLAIEDRYFFYHPGLDPIGIARAMVTNVQADAVVQGGSTITQQLAKNLFLTPERTIERKIQEAILAVWLEIRFTKEELLTIYLNRAYLGGGAYGVAAAAQRYFGKTLDQLSLPEAAMIAGLLKAPSRYAPTASRQRALERARVVIGAMEDAGFIDATTSEYARGLDIAVYVTAGDTSGGYVADWIADQASALAPVAGVDLEVYTTIDLGLQAYAGYAVQTVLEQQGPDANAGEAALVAVGPGGQVRAMVGGRSYQTSQFNRAVQAVRQPGSAFKPFVYLAALQRGYTPYTHVIDEPRRYGRYQPRNYKNRYYGRVTLTEALTKSMNTVAVALTKDIGPQTVMRTAQSLGYDAKPKKDLSIGLGTSGTSLLNLTGAYVPFANGGVLRPPYAITKIQTTDGVVLYTRPDTPGEQVISSRDLGAMNDMLRAVVEDGTGRRAQLPDRPSAGKTGTTSSFRDAVFVGYVPQLITGVWVGNDDNTPMEDVTGGRLPAEVWRAFMSAALQGEPVVDLPRGAPAPVREPQVASARGGLVGLLDKFFSTFGGGNDRRDARDDVVQVDPNRVPYGAVDPAHDGNGVAAPAQGQAPARRVPQNNDPGVRRIGGISIVADYPDDENGR